MAAHMEFNATQACSQATIEFGQGSLNASMSTLEAYCSPTCRDLNSRIIIECVSLITCIYTSVVYLYASFLASQVNYST